MKNNTSQAISSSVAAALILSACTLNMPGAGSGSNPGLDATRNSLEVTRLALVLTQTALAGSATAPGPQATSTPPPARATVTQAPAPATTTPEMTVIVEVPLSGRVEGKMFYPSSAIPAMTLYFENVKSGAVVKLPIKLNQMTYGLDLPPGDYYAYAWLPDFTLSGAHSTCRADNACDTHDLAPVHVKQGVLLTGIDIYDWYAPRPLRYPPGVKAPTGAVSGQVDYPASHVPAMTVYARNVATGATYSTAITLDQRQYTLKNLPVGSYAVFAWSKADGKNVMQTLGGLFSVAVSCGLTASCTDHSPVPVGVNANETTTGVNVSDWYDQPSVPQP